MSDQQVDLTKNDVVEICCPNCGEVQPFHSDNAAVIHKKEIPSIVIDGKKLKRYRYTVGVNCCHCNQVISIRVKPEWCDWFPLRMIYSAHSIRTGHYLWQN